MWSKPYNFNELLLKIQFNWSLFVKLRESLLISCLEPFWQNGRMWDGISIPLNFQMMWTRWKPTKLDIDWSRYSYLSSSKFYIKHYRIRTEANDWLRYILRTLQEIIHHNITANKGARQQLPAQTWNGNFVLDRDWSLELCAAVWQPSSCTPRVQIDKTPQQAPSLSCAGAGQTAVNQIWASDERERGEAGDKQRNLNSKLRAAEEGPSSRTLARGAGTSIRLILILQQQAVPHFRGNMSYYTVYRAYAYTQYS